MIVAIIPAKSNSIGLHEKNLKKFFGKSLVEHAVRSADIPEIDRIAVSTDSREIEQTVLDLNIEKAGTLTRPPGLVLDHVQVDEVVLYSLRQLQCIYNDIDTVVVLQPTSPLRTSRHVTKALEMYKTYNSGGDFAIWLDAGPSSLALFSGYWSSKYNYTGDFLTLRALQHNPMVRSGRQAYRARDVFVENGAIYIATAEHIGKYKTFRAQDMLGFEMLEAESVEIDDRLSWEIAHICAKRMGWTDGNYS